MSAIPFAHWLPQAMLAPTSPTFDAVRNRAELLHNATYQIAACNLSTDALDSFPVLHNIAGQTALNIAHWYELWIGWLHSLSAEDYRALNGSLVKI